jgi:hypothetical protein
MPDTNYTPADFSILRDTKYGVGFHWTPFAAPKTGDVGSFEDAVNAFDVPRFVRQVKECGAGHVLFTSTHAGHYFPCPHPVVDALLPGHTCQRDLVMEIADALQAENIPLILYYNPGIPHAADWTQACGYNNDDKSHYIENALAVVRYLAVHYGRKLCAFWFDLGWNFPGFPYDEMTQAAKSGNPDLLVTYNNSIEVYRSWTPYQDYWWGEGVRLNFVPRGGRLTPSGLPWYNFIDWHPDYFTEQRCGEWLISMQTRDLEWPTPHPDGIVNFIKRFEAVGGAVTLNLFIWRSGEIYEPDLAVMREVKKRLR